MQGTITRKLGRVIGNLMLHPQYLARGLSHNLLHDKGPLELGMPWFSYAAIDFLDLFLEPHMTVCEYGSGGSTVFFAQRAKSVFSIEDNPTWFELVSKKLRERSLPNVTLVLCPFDFKQATDFEHSAYLQAIPDERFDVIVVDGAEEWTPVRPVCFRKAESRVKRGGIIVLDDSWRYPELRRDHRAKEFKVFESVGPGRPGVTSTDVFFY